MNKFVSFQLILLLLFTNIGSSISFNDINQTDDRLLHYFIEITDYQAADLNYAIKNNFSNLGIYEIIIPYSSEEMILDLGGSKNIVQEVDDLEQQASYINISSDFTSNHTSAIIGPYVNIDFSKTLSYIDLIKDDNQEFNNGGDVQTLYDQVVSNMSPIQTIYFASVNNNYLINTSIFLSAFDTILEVQSILNISTVIWTFKIPEITKFLHFGFDHLFQKNIFLVGNYINSTVNSSPVKVFRPISNAVFDKLSYNIPIIPNSSSSNLINRSLLLLGTFIHYIIELLLFESITQFQTLNSIRNFITIISQSSGLNLNTCFGTINNLLKTYSGDFSHQGNLTSEIFKYRSSIASTPYTVSLNTYKNMDNFSVYLFESIYEEELDITYNLNLENNIDIFLLPSKLYIFSFLGFNSTVVNINDGSTKNWVLLEDEFIYTKSYDVILPVESDLYSIPVLLNNVSLTYHKHDILNLPSTINSLNIPNYNISSTIIVDTTAPTLFINDSLSSEFNIKNDFSLNFTILDNQLDTNMLSYFTFNGNIFYFMNNSMFNFSITEFQIGNNNIIFTLSDKAYNNYTTSISFIASHNQYIEVINNSTINYVDNVPILWEASILNYLSSTVYINNTSYEGILSEGSIIYNFIPKLGIFNITLVVIYGVVGDALYQIQRQYFLDITDNQNPDFSIVSSSFDLNINANYLIFDIYDNAPLSLYINNNFHSNVNTTNNPRRLNVLIEPDQNLLHSYVLLNIKLNDSKNAISHLIIGLWDDFRSPVINEVNISNELIEIDETITITIFFSDILTSSLYIYINNTFLSEILASEGIFSLSLDGFLPGIYEIQLYIVDYAGNHILHSLHLTVKEPNLVQIMTNRFSYITLGLIIFTLLVIISPILNRWFIS